MTLLYHDPSFLAHETGHHPERADRIRGVEPRLRQNGMAERCTRPAWEPVSRRRLARVHSPTYIDEVRAMAKSGGGEIDSETLVSPASYDVALLAAGCACDATERLVRGEDRRALCLVRPPGHHAVTSAGMGFCLFNNVAVGALVAVEELKLARVLIVDWDVHHGNGTQATFWEDPRVGFLSIHRWPFYPHTGDEDETGGGAGQGTTLNVPVEFGTPREEYLERFLAALDSFANQIQPQLVYISAGFDAHRLDPIGNLGLATEDYGTLTDAVLDVADRYAGGRVISVLEGGYNPEVMTDCIELHLGRMLHRDRAEG